MGIILVYDISRRDSFLNLDNYLRQIHDYATFQPKIILVGNKTDLESKREVSYQDGINFAQTHNLIFIETSVKQNINIENVFNSLTSEILNTPELVNRGVRPSSTKTQPPIKLINPVIFKENAPKCCK